MDIKTLTGKTLDEVYAELNKNLGAGAYKEVAVSGLNLTDISPAYRDEVFNQVFGICGYGWGYDYNSRDVEVENIKTRKGNDAYSAQISKINLWYKLVVDGETVVCYVPSTGHNVSYASFEYALKGAITSALGKSASHLGWQINIYKGEGVSKEVAPADVPAADVDFLTLASVFSDTKKMIELAVDSPLFQRLVLGALNGDALIKESIHGDVGDKAADAISKSFARLAKEAGVSAKDLVNDLTGKPFEKITYAEAIVLWDALAQIAGGADKDTIVKSFKLLTRGSSA